jgi:hypothetical protein
VTDDAERLLDQVGERKECLVELESIIFHLRQIKQVAHQILHDLSV